MRILLILLLFLAGSGRAQENGGKAQKQPGESSDTGTKAAAEVRRLESVTWNPVREELTWLVSVWNVASGVDQPPATERYVIHLDAAVMEVNGELRGFSPTEAKRVHTLMDMMSTYAVESTVWWNRGEGEPIDGQKVPPPNHDDETKKKNKGGGKEEKPEQAPKSPSTLRRAAVLAPDEKHTPN